MKYIQKNIEKILKQFDEPNHKLFFLDNSYSSIQELEEENLGSENTFKSKNSAVNENNYLFFFLFSIFLHEFIHLNIFIFII